MARASAFGLGGTGTDKASGTVVLLTSEIESLETLEAMKAERTAQALPYKGSERT